MRELELASGSAVRFEQLRGRLREIAERRLAAAVCGSRAMARGRCSATTRGCLLDRPLERDKFAPGPSPAELDRLLAALEQV